MKSLKTLLAQLLIVASLLLPWTIAGAVEDFQQVGIIKSVSYDKITIRDQEYRIAPKAKLFSNDAGRRQLSDFKKGDRIYLEGKMVGGVYYIEKIIYETPIDS